LRFKPYGRQRTKANKTSNPTRLIACKPGATPKLLIRFGDTASSYRIR
jgi:hypothetical protein